MNLPNYEASRDIFHVVKQVVSLSSFPFYTNETKRLPDDSQVNVWFREDRVLLVDYSPSNLDNCFCAIA